MKSPSILTTILFGLVVPTLFARQPPPVPGSPVLGVVEGEFLQIKADVVGQPHYGRLDVDRNQISDTPIDPSPTWGRRGGTTLIVQPNND